MWDLHTYPQVTAAVVVITCGLILLLFLLRVTVNVFILFFLTRPLKAASPFVNLNEPHFLKSPIYASSPPLSVRRSRGFGPCPDQTLKKSICLSSLIDGNATLCVLLLKGFGEWDAFEEASRQACMKEGTHTHTHTNTHTSSGVGLMKIVSAFLHKLPQWDCE